ncbi:MAG: GAF domain-containing sensor histidine kinase [Bacteroidota bacterium]
MNTKLEQNFQDDIDAISKIAVLPEMLDMICQTTGMGFAAVARVTDDRWIACAIEDKINFGLKPGGELKLETTICHEISKHGQAVAFDNALEDEQFRNHHTPMLYGLQSYISVPLILRNGEFFGTLCAIDPKPNLVNTKETIAMFKFYAELLAFHLSTADQLQKTELNLKREKEIAELREQFIAVLGHDLRNPVGAVRNAAQLMQRGKLDDGTILRLSSVLMNSSHRMSGLIDNVMDFARGRLGAGIFASIEPQNLDLVLNHVIEELKLIWPNRMIQTEIELKEKVNCDGKRIGQLFSNLLANALNHGDKDAPVVVKANDENKNFTLSIKNSGSPIPKETMKHLFEPFVRAKSAGHDEGLGLGLFISAEIARAHSGKIEVISNLSGTTFTFTMLARD